MSAPGDRESVSGAQIVEVSRQRGLAAHQWFSEAITRHNLALLGIISAFLTMVDTFQSFYLQRVVNQFNEANLLPLKFYGKGLAGYFLYSPIDFAALFVTLTVLWIWASYILWYYKQIIAPKFRQVF